MADLAGNPEDEYRVFTRVFDRVVASTDLDSVLGPLSRGQSAALNEAWDAFQNGLVGWRTKAHLAALAAAEKLQRHVPRPRLEDTVVAVLIDQSGSMRGQAMLLAAAAAAAADVAQDFLGHLGCKVEILGFTTVSWKGGRARRKWTWRLRPRQPGRLCELLHIVYRPAEEQRVSTGSWNYRSMLRPDLPKENVDGEALLWAAGRLKARPEQRRVLLVVSDGAPVDDSTLLANGPDILDRHLKAVVQSLTASREVEVAAVGVGFDVSRYYPTSSVIQTPDELGLAMIGLLERVLSKAAEAP